MEALGFSVSVPEQWNRWWLAMWAVVSVGLLVGVFFVPFWPVWLIAAAVFFLIPELISVSVKNDSLPPLTHTVRHFLPNWLAFPLIYGLRGSIGATWLDFPRPFRLGGLYSPFSAG